MKILYTISFLFCICLWSCGDQLLPSPPGANGPDEGMEAIAFSEITEPGQWMKLSRTYAIVQDGNTKQLLTEGMVALVASKSNLVTMPDTTTIHVLSMKSRGLALRTVVSGTPAIDPYTLAVSPAGDRIAYTTRGNRQTTLTGSDGSNSVQLSIAVADSAVPAFSPDGRQLAFVGESSGRQLYIVDSDGVGLRLLADLPIITSSRISTIDWAPDGTRLLATAALDRDTHAMFLVEISTGKWQQIGWGFAPRWSPDGTRIAYTATTNATSDRDIYIVDINEPQSAYPVTESASEQVSSNLRVQWSPDGKKLLYVHIQGSIGNQLKMPGTLMLLDLGSGSEKLLADNVFKGFWIQ